MEQFCLQGSKRKFNSRSNSVENTHVFWKGCNCQPRVLNVKKTRCSLAPSMRSEALCEQITSGDVSCCVAFWFVKSPLLRSIRNIRICMGKKPIVSVTYENENFSHTNPYLSNIVTQQCRLSPMLIFRTCWATCGFT